MLRIRVDRWQRNDGEVGLEAEQVVRGRADEEVAREQAVPGELGDNADVQAVPRIGAGEHVLGVDVVARAELIHAPQQPFEARARDGLVARVPPDGTLAGGLFDEELVLGRPAGVAPGFGGQGARGYDRGLISAYRVLVEHGWSEVASCRNGLRRAEEIRTAGC